MNLMKELSREKQKTLDGSQQVIEEASRLLQAASTEEDAIMRMAGLGEQLRNYDQDAKSIYLERTKLDEKYKGDIYSEEEIKMMCMKYGLRFLPAELYQGTVPASTAAALNKFLDEQNVGKNYGLRNFVRILAPDNAFRLQDAKLRPAPDPDPILFYYVGDSKYKAIIKWGRDLTAWNYIKAYRRRSTETYVTVNTLVLSFVLNTIATMLIGSFAPWWAFASFFVMSFVISWGYTYKMGQHYDERCLTREEVWNKNLKFGGI